MMIQKKTYQPEDIISTSVEYESRSWWPACRGLGRKVSEYRYEKEKALCFTTNDGKYTTGNPDSDNYSYWSRVTDTDEEDIHGFNRLGATGCDYVFGCVDGLDRAVRVLNSLI